MNPDMPQSVPKDSETGTPPPGRVVLKSNELFGGQKEIDIEHDGVRYRLRITRRNKLILQK